MIARPDPFYTFDPFYTLDARSWDHPSHPL